MGGRIAPVSASLVLARRDPRLARAGAAAPPPAPSAPAMPPALAAVPPAATTAPIAPNVFDIKPLGKRRNVLSYDVQPLAPRRRDPRLDKRERREKGRREPKKPDDRKRPELRKNDVEPRKARLDKERKLDEEAAKEKTDSYIEKLMIADPKKINKLPPIPKKVNRDEPKDKEALSPAKRAKEDGRLDKKKRRDDSKDSSSGSSPEKRPKAERKTKPRERRAEPAEIPAEPELVTFKELRNYHKERYMRRNKEKSESPDTTPLAPAEPEAPPSKLYLSVSARQAPVILVVSDAESTCCVQIKCFSTAGVFILTCFATS